MTCSVLKAAGRQQFYRRLLRSMAPLCYCYAAATRRGCCLHSSTEASRGTRVNSKQRTSATASLGSMFCPLAFAGPGVTVVGYCKDLSSHLKGCLCLETKASVLLLKPESIAAATEVLLWARDRAAVASQGPPTGGLVLVCCLVESKRDQTIREETQTNGRAGFRLISAARRVGAS